MKSLNFAFRNYREIIRDPLSVIFCLLLPLFLLFIFQQFEIPNDAFLIENFTPGIVIFGFSFITLFTATLVSKDRSTSFLTRLGASPMRPCDYILGYTLAILPIVIIQNVVFFVTAVLLGLPLTINILVCILSSIPASLLFIALGILIGCITSDRSAPGVSSIVVQLVAFTSGMYFSADMVGKFFAVICDILPFSWCVKFLKGILSANNEGIGLAVVKLLLYTVVLYILATVIFKKKSVRVN